MKTNSFNDLVSFGIKKSFAKLWIVWNGSKKQNADYLFLNISPDQIARQDRKANKDRRLKLKRRGRLFCRMGRSIRSRIHWAGKVWSDKYKSSNLSTYRWRDNNFQIWHVLTLIKWSRIIDFLKCRISVIKSFLHKRLRYPLPSRIIQAFNIFVNSRVFSRSKQIKPSRRSLTLILACSESFILW